jgi:hypothetical protein
MALSYARDRFKANRTRKYGFGVITLDTDYPAGGWPVAAASLDPGLSQIDNLIVTSPPGFTAVWDNTNKKLMMRDPDGTEAAAGDNALDGLKVSVWYEGQ